MRRSFRIETAAAGPASLFFEHSLLFTGKPLGKNRSISLYEQF